MSKDDYYDPPMDVTAFGVCINTLVGHAGSIAALPLEQMVEHIDYHLEHPDSERFIDPETRVNALMFGHIVAAAIHLRDTVDREVKS